MIEGKEKHGDEDEDFGLEEYWLYMYAIYWKVEERGYLELYTIYDICDCLDVSEWHDTPHSY